MTRFISVQWCSQEVSIKTSTSWLPMTLPTNRQHLSYSNCLEGKRGDYLTSSVLLCIVILLCTSYAHLYNEQFAHGRLDRALILLGLAVFQAPLSSVYLVLYVEKILLHPFSFIYLLVCWACGIGPLPGRLSSFSAITLLVGSSDV